MQVVGDAAEKMNINDGCLLDFKRIPAETRAPKRPGYWKFVKRADHKAKPSLMEVAQIIADPEPGWNKDSLTAACGSMKPLSDQRPTAPMSPV